MENETPDECIDRHMALIKPLIDQLRLEMAQHGYSFAIRTNKDGRIDFNCRKQSR